MRRIHTLLSILGLNQTAMLLLFAAGFFGALEGCGGGSAAPPPPPPPISVSLSNAPATVQAGATAQDTATVANDSSNKGVTWTLTQGGTSCSPACGTVAPTSTASGSPTTYTAPAGVPASSSVTITATSVADTTKSAGATFTITPPNPVPFVNLPLVPDAVVPGGAPFTLRVNGTGFVSGSVVNWNGSALTTTFVSSSKLTASVSASDIANAATASITVVSPKQGGGTSNEVFFPIATSSASVGLSGSVFSTDTGPGSIATGDFNGDGKLDLVVPDTVSGNVSILLGKGDGTFQPAVNYPVGQGSSFQFFQVAVADFNGDGKLDFVVSNFNGNNVSVFLGNGDGTFQAAASHNVGTNPTSVAVADVNGDGKLDLVVSNQNCNNAQLPCGPGTVSVLLGNGDGTFQAHADYAAGTGPNWVTVGDFNGDGKLDLAVANGQGACPGCQSAFSILLGNGDGTFQPPATYFGGTNPASIATADFNGDGKLDLVLVDNIGSIWIFLGNGDGTFQTASAVEYITDSFPWGSIGIGDFNGDGKLDLAIVNSGSNDVEIFLGNGDGTFQSPTRFNTGSFPHCVAVGDFNNDGRLDLAVPNNKDNTVSVLLQ